MFGLKDGFWEDYLDIKSWLWITSFFDINSVYFLFIEYFYYIACYNLMLKKPFENERLYVRDF